MASIEYLRHFASFGDNRIQPLLVSVVERAHSFNRPDMIRGLSRSLKYIGSSAVSKFDTRQDKGAVFQSEGFEGELSELSEAAFDLMNENTARDLDRRLARLSSALWGHASDVARSATSASDAQLISNLYKFA